jgi:hypothetical protein
MPISSKTRIAVGLLVLMISISSCDRRGSLDTRNRDVPNFSVDLTAVIDYSSGNRIVEVTFERDNLPFSTAVITIDDQEIPPAGGGYYFIESPVFALDEGLTEIVFQSADDDYEKTITITIPDSFAVTEVSPWYNPDADEVYVEWSPSDGASGYVVGVATDNYYDDGTVPMTARLSSGDNFLYVPDTTFEDFAGDVVPAVYYIYVIAFNRGLGPYSGIKFPLPAGLPRQTISDPSGFLQYGTVAPLDSIVVPRLTAD